MELLLKLDDKMARLDVLDKRDTVYPESRHWVETEALATIYAVKERRKKPEGWGSKQ